MHLGGLTSQEVGHVVEAIAGVSPTPGLIETVHTRTEGNPLFVTETVRLLAQERLEEAQGLDARIPEGVRDAIGRRLSRLSDLCNQVLTTASAAGREFDFKLLARLDLCSEAQLLEVLEEAQQAGIVEEAPSGMERYQFSHALIQGTLLDELSTSRRVRLHARIGAALEELYGTGAENHAAELAHHLAEAQTVLGIEKLVHYSLLAGERALASFGNEEALVFFQRALAAKEGQPTDGETAELRFGLARAQGATLDGSQRQEALATLSRAFDYYAEVRDVDCAVAVAEYHFQGPPGILASAVQLLASALELVPSDSHEAGRLLCRYGLVQGRETGDYERSQEAFSRALNIARREGDVALEMRALVNAANVDRFQDRYQENLRNSLRAIELARLTADPRAEVDAHYWAGASLTTLGDLEKARLHAAAMLNLAKRLRSRYWLAGAFFRNAMVSYLEGEWMTARDYASQGLSASSMDHRILSILAILEYQVGEFSQGEAHLERILDTTSSWPTGVHGYHKAIFIPQIAHISGELDRLDVAEVAAEAVLS